MKRSVALVIPGPGAGDVPDDVLVVQRPEDDEDLPLAWGLPAASLLPGESWEDAVRRAARDKLGVEVEPGAVLQEGTMERPAYRLEMRLYRASIVAGEPDVPRGVAGVTQYRAWRWGRSSDLADAAGRGSLCSRLFLAWQEPG